MIRPTYELKINGDDRTREFEMLQMKNFHPRELACPCCQRSELAEDFLLKLEGLREDVGFPLPVTSGFRCEKHNGEIPGAAKNSQHMQGLAVDISTKSMTASHRFLLLEKALALGFKGIGVYAAHIHLDERKEGAFWLGGKV
jgi:zinc D-Ala-D-Ala carboxypeptidase